MSVQIAAASDEVSGGVFMFNPLLMSINYNYNYDKKKGLVFLVVDLYVLLREHLSEELQGYIVHFFRILIKKGIKPLLTK